MKHQQVMSNTNYKLGQEDLTLRLIIHKLSVLLYGISDSDFESTLTIRNLRIQDL